MTIREAVEVVIQELCRQCQMTSCRECLHLKEALEGRSVTEEIREEAEYRGIDLTNNEGP